MSPSEPERGSANDERPLVSCLIIFLDEERFLAEAIESVLAQTYANWELILVDDGSTDGSEQIALAYAARDPDRIRYVTHENRENRGMSTSRNLAMRTATGELAAFLDGDDTWLPDKLERQIALFTANPEAIMICGSTIYWHEWSEAAERPDRVVGTGDVRLRDGTVVNDLEQERLHPVGSLLTQLYPLGKGATPSSSGNIFCRETALAIGGYEESFRGMFEDQVFRAKIYLAGPVFVTSQVFDRYRQHEESCSQVTRATNSNAEPRLRYFRWLESYLDEVSYRGAAARTKLRNGLMRYRYPLLYRIWSSVRTGLSEARRRRSGSS